MAARSDFAQKLLHDLRLRKERMASSQGSGYSSQSSSRGEVGVQNTGKTDLSMAIAISIGNSEKFTKLDFMGKIMDGNSFPSKCQFVTLSNVSKGIQKINQILKTSCSNGSSVNNSDTCSIKVVEKELLKGAMDLESSLRMLVNLQEASSNHINSSQRRNQHVTSLVEDEYRVDDVKTADQKQLDLPRFSFDKPSKKSYTKKETRDGGKNEFLALTYHKRSISCIPEFKDDSANLEPKSQSTSLTHGAGKGRISNVIAKLMGLDEFPQNANLKASGQSTSKKGSGNFLKNEREPTDNNNFLKQHTTEKDDPHPILPQKLKIEAAGSWKTRGKASQGQSLTIIKE